MTTRQMLRNLPRSHLIRNTFANRQKKLRPYAQTKHTEVSFFCSFALSLQVVGQWYVLGCLILSGGQSPLICTEIHYSNHYYAHFFLRLRGRQWISTIHQNGRQTKYVYCTLFSSFHSTCPFNIHTLHRALSIHSKTHIPCGIVQESWGRV